MPLRFKDNTPFEILSGAEADVTAPPEPPPPPSNVVMSCIEPL